MLWKLIGSVSRSLGELTKAKEYHFKALAPSKETADVELENACYVKLANDMLFEGNMHEAVFQTS